MYNGPDSQESNLRAFRAAPPPVPSRNCEPLLTILNGRVQSLLDHLESLEERIEHIERVTTGSGSESEPADMLSAGGIRIDHAARRVFVNEAEITLSPTEYKLMYQLAANAGKVVLHRDLLRRASGSSDGSRTNLKVYIGRLRAKLNEAAETDMDLEAVRGVGYRLVA